MRNLRIENSSISSNQEQTESERQLPFFIGNLDGNQLGNPGPQSTRNDSFIKVQRNYFGTILASTTASISLPAILAFITHRTENEYTLSKSQFLNAFQSRAEQTSLVCALIAGLVIGKAVVDRTSPRNLHERSNSLLAHRIGIAGFLSLFVGCFGSVSPLLVQLFCFKEGEKQWLAPILGTFGSYALIGLIAQRASSAPTVRHRHGVVPIDVELGVPNSSIRILETSGPV